ncbi:hypothetical protein Hanom_Chr16g01426751 [Helianthus anomalus]
MIYLLCFRYTLTLWLCFGTPIVLNGWFTFILLDIKCMFNMIGGLILVSHAPKRWNSAGGFWGCDKHVQPLVQFQPAHHLVQPVL